MRGGVIIKRVTAYWYCTVVVYTRKSTSDTTVYHSVPKSNATSYINIKFNPSSYFGGVVYIQRTTNTTYIR